MKVKCTLCVLGVTLFLLAGCGSSEPERTDVPALPEVPSEQPGGATIAGYEAIQVTDGGSIAGTISVSGTIPRLPRRQLGKNPEVCGTGSRDSEQLLVNRTAGLKNAVVLVEGVKRGTAVPVESQNAQIDQMKCEYGPHVQVMPVNAELAVVNSDPILHNIHLYQGDETVFNLAQPIQQVNRQKLQKAGFVYVECDVHGWMQAHIAVVDNPYYAVTDENGKFSIGDLPAGTYRVKVWHEYLGEQTQEITVAGNAEAALNLDLKDLLARKTAPPVTAAPSAAPASAGSDAPANAPATASAAPGEVTVQMHAEGASFRFEPPNITVKAGTTVRWVNASDNRHTATDDPESEKETGRAILPSGAEPWTSPFLPMGESFRKTFTVAGKYQYFCRNHEQFGMIGTITVVP